MLLSSWKNFIWHTVQSWHSLTQRWRNHSPIIWLPWLSTVSCLLLLCMSPLRSLWFHRALLPLCGFPQFHYEVPISSYGFSQQLCFASFIVSLETPGVCLIFSFCPHTYYLFYFSYLLFLQTEFSVIHSYLSSISLGLSPPMPILLFNISFFLL